jgi:hypothetical protein
MLKRLLNLTEIKLKIILSKNYKIKKIRLWETRFQKLKIVKVI